MSLTGTWMRRTALGWLVYQLEGSMVLLGAVMALALFPLFIFSPLAGSLADLVDKRRMIIHSQFVAGLASAVIALLVYTNTIETWQVMVLATIGGVAFAFEVPARQAFVVEMVGKRHLLNAIALNSALVNATRIVGPALAGFIMAAGMHWCFVADAVSYFIVIGTLIGMVLPPFVGTPRTRSHLAMLAEGVREAWTNTPVRLAMALMACLGIFGFSFQTLLPAIAQDDLMLSEFQYGVLMAISGVGAIVGALVVSSRGVDSNRPLQMFAAIFISALSAFGVALSRTYVPMLCALLVFGFGGILYISTAITLVQLSVADSIRGRVMGIWALTFGGALPLGSFAIGLLAEHTGPFTAIGIFGVVLALAGVMFYITQYKEVLGVLTRRRENAST